MSRLRGGGAVRSLIGRDATAAIDAVFGIAMKIEFVE